ncbi:MAG: ferrochelatase [Thermoproteota archaeon]|jgi:ferrochelatase
MKAVLLMAYGAPRNLNEVEEYFTHIRGGRKPTKEEVDELISRYKAIGKSPLIEITEAQAKKLQAKIKSLGSETVVFYAMKHSEPFIEKVVDTIVEKGFKELLCIVLAPHYSIESVETYFNFVRRKISEKGSQIQVKFVKSWHNNECFIEAWVSRIREAEKKIGKDYWLLFSAHSLPERILKMNDPYVDQLLETCRLIANKIGKKEWSFTFQSAGMTREKWLGPDIIQHLEELYEKNIRKVLVAPIGFVTDNLEILYDLDIECKNWAKNKGIVLERCEMLNDSDLLVNCLVDIVKSYGFL